ncbi:glycosyltransferase family 39 protein [Rufibacter psychrotolerans]|uniref:glycosyltransferase family 39 protein n=1 Tax=Rufibacter psychrotolerans TaxID=2812556 RepID=UPI001966D84E|nr:glycosyltransferase family 39 protein [Rufibacter sp. SYSU D00308]
MSLSYKTVASPTARAAVQAPLVTHPDQARSRQLIPLLTFLVLLVGTFLRLYHFVDNRSLWRDELYLAVSLVKMGFWELASQPLAYEQKAPLGFLWAVRLSVEVFGKGEMALRLFPLLCGLTAPVVFAPVARHFLKPWAALLAVTMLALASPIIYHSVEAKQYSTELLAAIIALYLYVRWHRGEGSLLGWGLAGAVLVWFSYSAIFVLAGIAGAVGLQALREEGWKAALRFVLPFGLWLCSFATVYLLFLGRYQDSEWLTVFFEKYCRAYLPVASIASLPKWFFLKANELVKNPLGQTFKFAVASPAIFVVLRFLPLLLLALGVALLPKKNFRKFAVLAFPLGLALLASGLKFYPFYERLVLFLAPVLILFMVYGAQTVVSWCAERQAVKYLLVAALVAPLVYNALREVSQPDHFLNKEKSREALLFINDRYQPNDAVYVYWNMWHAYLYYKEAYNLKFTAIEGKDLKITSATQAEYLQKLAPSIAQAKGHDRLWFLYDSYLRINIGGYVEQPAWYYHPTYQVGQNVEQVISGMGQRMPEAFREKDAAVSLFKLAP